MFKDVWAVRAEYAGQIGTFACGTVNAKNGFGGYIGFTPFVAIGSTVVTPYEPMFAGVFQQVCLDGEKVVKLR